MNSYESFVYCWTDTKRNMLYVGKHKGDINDGYICSSKYFLSEYKNCLMILLELLLLPVMIWI